MSCGKKFHIIRSWCSDDYTKPGKYDAYKNMTLNGVINEWLTSIDVYEKFEDYMRDKSPLFTIKIHKFEAVFPKGDLSSPNVSVFNITDTDGNKLQIQLLNNVEMLTAQYDVKFRLEFKYPVFKEQVIQYIKCGGFDPLSSKWILPSQLLSYNEEFFKNVIFDIRPMELSTENDVIGHTIWDVHIVFGNYNDASILPKEELTINKIYKEEV